MNRDRVPHCPLGHRYWDRRAERCSGSSLVALNLGEADQRYDLANRQDGGLMIDLVDPDGVTAEWLTEVFLAEGVLGSGSVVSCAAEALAAMSFTGVFRRLELSYDVDEPGLPRTLIAKFSTPDPGIRAAVHSMGFYAREAAFYRELAATTPVPVPVCYYAAVDENDGRCVILLQDLTTARRGRSTDACSPAEVERAIDAIAPLHARWWQNPDLEFLRWLDPEGIMPLEATQPEFEAQWPVFLEKLSIPITDQVRQFGEWAAVELRTVMQRLFYEPPLTVIHHDFQADNLLFGRASDSVPLVVIDWQMLVRKVAVQWILPTCSAAAWIPETAGGMSSISCPGTWYSWRQLGFGTTTLSNAWRTTAPPCCCRRSASPSRSPQCPI